MNNMIIGNKEFRLDNNEVYIMGILNVTPDSFSDGNKHNTMDAALKHTEKMIEEGASIIDVGGESTRPGHIQISNEEEIERVVPVVERIKQEFDIPVSVDTYKYKVAMEAFKAGTDMLNDIWGLLYDEGEMAKIVSEYNAAVCLMHNDTEPMGKNNMMKLIDRLNKSIEVARNNNIDNNKIMIDPGIGFAKSYENNIHVMKYLHLLQSLDLPILLGVSNKSMIGIATDTTVDNRLHGSVATALYGISKGVKFVRVHNVAAHKQALDMIKAIEDSEF